jgi:hypothetical protein
VQQLLNIVACSTLVRTVAVELREKHALKRKKVGLRRVYNEHVLAV